MDNSPFNEYQPAIGKTLDLLSNAVKIATREEDHETVEKVLEIDTTLRVLSLLLRSADPLLINSEFRTNLLSTIEQIAPFLENYIADPEGFRNNVDTALSQLDTARKLFSHLIPVPTESGVENLRETVANARRSATHQLRAMLEGFRENLAELDELYLEKQTEYEKGLNTKQLEIEGDFESKFTDFQTTVTEKQEEFNETLEEMRTEVTSLEKLANETTDTIKTQKDRLDNAIAEYQKQFSERISDYQKQFSEGEDERRRKLELSIQSRERAYNKEKKERTADLDALKTEIEKVSQELVEQLRGFAKEAEVTVNLISEKSLQNDYIIQANKEKNSARLWNGATFFTVVLLLFAIGFIFYHTIVFPPSAEQTSYVQLLSKFLITAVIGIVARWTSRQANRRSAEERRLRRLALELATINPFINNLEPDKQSAIKELLALRYYGNFKEENAPFGELGTTNDGNDGLKSILESTYDKLRGKS